MKKLKAILLFCLPLVVTAQVAQIQLDPSTKKTDYVDDAGNVTSKYVQHGDDVTFKITEINRHRYDVKVNGEVITYPSQTPPAALLKFAGLEGQNTTPPAAIPTPAKLAGSQTAAAVQAHSEALKEAEENALIIDYFAKYDALKDAVRKLETSKSLYQQIQAEILSGKSKSDIISAVDAFANGFDPAPAMGITARLAYYKNQVEDAFEEEGTVYAKVAALAPSADDKVNAMMKAMMVTSQSEKNNILSNVKSPSAPADVTRVKELHKKTEEVKKEIDAYKYDELASNLQSIYTSAKDEKMYTFISDGIPADGDEVKFSYEITPKKDLKPAPPAIGSGGYVNLWAKGGWQVQFASGVSFNTIGLLSNSFHTVDKPKDLTNPADTIDMVSIKREKKNDWFIPNAAAYAHFNTRVLKNLKLGVTVGVALDFENISESNFNTGFSLIVGKKYSVAFTTGIAIGKATVLNNRYELDTTYKKADVDTDALTKSGVRAGLFLGVSLNLAGIDLSK